MIPRIFFALPARDSAEMDLTFNRDISGQHSKFYDVEMGDIYDDLPVCDPPHIAVTEKSRIDGYIYCCRCDNKSLNDQSKVKIPS